MQVLFAGWKQTGSKHTTHSGLLKQSMVRGQNTAVSTDKPKDQSLKKSCFLSSYGVRGQRFGDERSAVQCAVCWCFLWAAGKGPQQGSASIASLLWPGGGMTFPGLCVFCIPSKHEAHAWGSKGWVCLVCSEWFWGVKNHWQEENVAS